MPEEAKSRALLLALDTCGLEGSAVLAQVDGSLPSSGGLEILASARFAARTHAAQLIPRIAELFTSQNATLGDVQAIVVVRGPGSFTGIRVGLSAAKGLAEGAGIKLIAVSRLAVLASTSGLKDVLALIGAGRNEYYAGYFQEGAPSRERLLSASEVEPAARQDPAPAIVCESIDKIDKGEQTSGHASSIGGDDGWIRLPPIDAADALRFAMERFRSQDFDDPETLEANYLRRSDAELFGAVGTGIQSSESPPVTHG